MNVHSGYPIMDKREQILEATADLIAEQGLQCCPMAKIAQHAGCGAGTIYRHFSTKDELVQQLYLYLTEKMARRCLCNQNLNTSIRAAFDHFWGNFYRFMLDNPRDQGLLEQLWASPAICSTLQEQAMKEMHDQIATLLAKGKEEGQIKPLQDELLLTMTFGSLFNIAKKLKQAPELFSGQIELPDLLDMCWDAICIRQPS